MLQKGIDLIKVEKDGVLLGLTEIHYRRSLCGSETILEFSSVNDLSIGDKIQLFVDGVSKGTFYIERKELIKGGEFRYSSADNLKWVRDYFYDELISTNSSDTNTSIISKVMNAAGVPYTIQGRSVPVGENSSFGMQSALDIVRNLSKMSDLYFYVENDTVVFKNLSYGLPVASFSEENTISLTLEEQDGSYRNRVIIWGAYSLWEDRWLHWQFTRNTDWQIDGNDIRVVLFSNSGIKTFTNAKQIADSILNIFSNRNVVKIVEFPEVNIGIDISDIVSLDFDSYQSDGMIYELRIDATKNSGVITTIVVDDICPNILANISDYRRYLYITSDVDGVYRIECLFGGFWEDYNSGLYDKGVRDLKIRLGNKALVTYSGNTFVRRYGPEWKELPKYKYIVATGIDIKRDGGFITSEVNAFYSGNVFYMTHPLISGLENFPIYSCTAIPGIYSAVVESRRNLDGGFSQEVLKTYSGAYVYDVDIDGDKPILSIASYGGFSGNYKNCLEPQLFMDNIEFNGYIENGIPQEILISEEGPLFEWDTTGNRDRIITSNIRNNNYQVSVQYFNGGYKIEVINKLWGIGSSKTITIDDIDYKRKHDIFIGAKIVPPVNYIESTALGDKLISKPGAGVVYVGGGKYIVSFLVFVLEADSNELDSNGNPREYVYLYAPIVKVDSMNQSVNILKIISIGYMSDILISGSWERDARCVYKNHAANINSNTVISRVDGIVGYIKYETMFNADYPPPINCTYYLYKTNTLKILAGEVDLSDDFPYYGDFYTSDGVGYDFYSTFIGGTPYTVVNGYVEGVNTINISFTPIFNDQFSTPFVCSDVYSDLFLVNLGGQHLMRVSALGGNYFYYQPVFPSGTYIVAYSVSKNGYPFVVLSNSGVYQIEKYNLRYLRNVNYPLSILESGNYVYFRHIDYKGGMAYHNGKTGRESGFVDLEEGIFIPINTFPHPLGYGSNASYDQLSCEISDEIERIDGKIRYWKGIPATPRGSLSITGYIVADLDNQVYRYSTEKLHVETRRPFETKIWEVVDTIEGNYYSGVYDLRANLTKEKYLVATVSGLYNYGELISSGSGIVQAVEICNGTPVYAIIESGNYFHTIYYGDTDITYNYITSGNVTSLRIDDMR